MPIAIERIEEGSVEELRAGGQTIAEAVLSFLVSSSDQAYTPREIYEATSVARGSVGVVLSRLEDRGLVRQGGEYWAIGDGEDIEKTLSALASARAATDQLGPEDPDERGPGVNADDEGQ